MREFKADAKKSSFAATSLKTDKGRDTLHSLFLGSENFEAPVTADQVIKSEAAHITHLMR